MAINPIILILSSIYFFLPAYIANMAPIFVKKWNFLSSPISEKVFGSHKTWRGIIIATFAGAITFLVQQSLYQAGFIQLSIIDYSDFPFYFGALLGFGAIIGDLVKSYYKRKEGIPAGKKWMPYDQIDFAIGGIIASCIYYVPSAGVVLIILISSPLLHIASSMIGYKLKLRNEKW